MGEVDGTKLSVSASDLGGVYKSWNLGDEAVLCRMGRTWTAMKI